MLKIISAIFAEEYQIIFLLQNKTKIIYDMKPKITTARFSDLENEEVFKEGEICAGGKLIRWNTNTEISLEEMLYF